MHFLEMNFLPFSQSNINVNISLSFYYLCHLEKVFHKSWKKNHRRKNIQQKIHYSFSKYFPLDDMQLTYSSTHFSKQVEKPLFYFILFYFGKWFKEPYIDSTSCWKYFLITIKISVTEFLFQRQKRAINRMMRDLEY